MTMQQENLASELAIKHLRYRRRKFGGPKSSIEKESGKRKRERAIAPRASMATSTTKDVNDDAARTKIETSFVITGFGPFGGVAENPTTTIVRKLDSYLRSKNIATNTNSNKGVEDPEGSSSTGDNDNDSDGDHANYDEVADLVKEYVILETSAHDVNERMDRICRECCSWKEQTAHQTAKTRLLLLHLGVARSKGFRLESCAYNQATFRIPDERGFQPTDQAIVSDASHEVGKCYETTLDLETLRGQLQQAFPGISTVVSTDPGRFVCNYVYCRSLEVSRSYAQHAAARKPTPCAEHNDSSQEQEQPQEQPQEEPSKNKSLPKVSVGNENDDTTMDSNFSCKSLFLHVPHFAIVPEDEQLAYVACLLRNLAAQGT